MGDWERSESSCALLFIACHCAPPRVMMVSSFITADFTEFTPIASCAAPPLLHIADIVTCVTPTPEIARLSSTDCIALVLRSSANHAPHRCCCFSLLLRV